MSCQATWLSNQVLVVLFALRRIYLTIATPLHIKPLPSTASSNKPRFVPTSSHLYTPTLEANPLFQNFNNLSKQI